MLLQSISFRDGHVGFESYPIPLAIFGLSAGSLISLCLSEYKLAEFL